MAKIPLVCVGFLALIKLQALEFETHFENEQVSVSKVVIEPREEIGLHRDGFPQIVVALKGGTITRLESNGREVEVQFPTGKAVFRPVDPVGELHRSVNRSDDQIELIVVQLKN